jgi:hypothetical protein
MSQRCAGAGLLACLFLSLLGCKAKDKGPPCYPVRGKVLYRGEAAANVDVYFHPVGAGSERAQRPHGRTNAQGELELTTRRRGDGAPEGEYRVTFFWAEAENVEEPADRLGGRYRDPATSAFRIQVRPEENKIDPFNLQ